MIGVILISFFPLQPDCQVFVVVENLFKFVQHKSDLFHHLVWLRVLSELYCLYYALVELFTQAMRSFNLDVWITQADHVCQNIRVYFVKNTLECLYFPSSIVSGELLAVCRTSRYDSNCFVLQNSVSDGHITS